MSEVRPINLSKETDAMWDAMKKDLEKDFNGAKSILDALYYLKKRIDEQEKYLEWLERRNQPYGEYL